VLDVEENYWRRGKHRRPLRPFSPVRNGCSVTTATPPFKVVPSRTFAFIWRQAGEVSKRFSTVVRCGAYEVKWVDFGQNCLLRLVNSHVWNRDKTESLFQASETAAKQKD
jgi:hypothetical protein